MRLEEVSLQPRSSFTQASTGARPLADIMVPKHFYAELLRLRASALGAQRSGVVWPNQTLRFAFQTLQSQTPRVQNS